MADSFCQDKAVVRNVDLARQFHHLHLLHHRPPLLSLARPNPSAPYIRLLQELAARPRAPQTNRPAAAILASEPLFASTTIVTTTIVPVYLHTTEHFRLNAYSSRRPFWTVFFWSIDSCIARLDHTPLSNIVLTNERREKPQPASWRRPRPPPNTTTHILYRTPQYRLAENSGTREIRNGRRNNLQQRYRARLHSLKSMV